MLTLVAAIATLYTILVPAYGALLAPTFAERLPWHTHVAAAGAADGFPGALVVPAIAGAAAVLCALRS